MLGYLLVPWLVSPAEYNRQLTMTLESKKLIGLAFVRIKKDVKKKKGVNVEILSLLL